MGEKLFMVLMAVPLGCMLWITIAMMVSTSTPRQMPSPEEIELMLKLAPIVCGQDGCQ